MCTMNENLAKLKRMIKATLNRFWHSQSHGNHVRYGQKRILWRISDAPQVIHFATACEHLAKMHRYSISNKLQSSSVVPDIFSSDSQPNYTRNLECERHL